MATASVTKQKADYTRFLLHKLTISPFLASAQPIFGGGYGFKKLYFKLTLKGMMLVQHCQLTAQPVRYVGYVA